CEAGGSCDPVAPRGAIIFGLPGLEHQAFVGSRGKGVEVNPATLQHICPDHAPQCQPAPNHGLKPPVLLAARWTKDRITVTVAFPGAPAGRYLVELFGNVSGKNDEAEIFLGEGAASTSGRGSESVMVFVVATGVTREPRSIVATVTSFDGATSPLSVPLVIGESSPR